MKYCISTLAPKVGCNATYIGYTTCQLRKRAQQHKYKSSSIFKHHSIEHPDDTGILPGFFDDFIILHRSEDLTNLRTLEAIYIKEQNPQINVKFNELSNHMNLYKWSSSPIWWWCLGISHFFKVWNNVLFQTLGNVNPDKWMEIFVHKK